MPPVLYLIDGHALAYRTYFALTAAGGGRWQTRSGEPTAGIFGFTSVLLRLLEQENPEYLAVAFDTGKSFRDEMYPGYKATRAKMPDDLRPQIERIRQLIDVFHFPRLELEGYEADDVIGSIAYQAVEKGFGVKIITGDRDLLQLVSDRIIVNLAGSKLSEAKDYFPKDVMDNLGILPSQVVDYKALVGDSSDNIPGVTGIGQKTALSLLNKYQTLENIYAHLDELPPRTRTLLETGREMAQLSKKLATINTQLHISLELEKARTNQIDFNAVEDLFRELEFRSLMGRIKSLAQPSQPSKSPETTQLSLFGKPITHIGGTVSYQPITHIIDSQESLDILLQQLNSASWIAIDTETTSTHAMSAKIVGISLAVREGEGYYIPLGHRTERPQLSIQLVAEALRPILSSSTKHTVGHNLKYDGIVLNRHGIAIERFNFDTMLALWLLDPATRRLGLKDAAQDYLNIEMTHIEELIGKGKNQISMAEVPIEKVAPYAIADAEVTLRLMPVLKDRLKESNSYHLLTDIEMPLVPVLMEMEQNGICLDVPFFKAMSVELSQRLADLEQQICTSIGYTFNLNSTQQLSKALFETLRLEPPDRRHKTSSGLYSTSADVLEQLRGKHPSIDWLLEYRELAKLKSTYVDVLPEQVNPETGRVHTSYQQTGSVTGRLASADPNLQNIPIRTEIGQRVRQGFIASPGNLLLAVDYSQIELRLVAHMSGDENMLQAFRQGQDIHAATAAAIYGVPLEQVTKEQRRNAKAVNFGLIYGMSAFGLSNSTSLTLGEAEEFVRSYFQQFPGVKSYLDNIRRIASRQGYVETLLGRRRYFPNLKNQSNPAVRSREEREAINAPIQGTAADIIKLAMIQLPPALSKEGLKARLLLQVHDELILECPEDEITQTAAIVTKVMEGAYQLSIPLSTEARFGKNWGSLQKN
ncbi:MAG: DNA polymerase I [Anaerolineae bacterium]|nr:DNA polymerase I [Anaerolineae bacterium]